jgi:hypothetical protein
VSAILNRRAADAGCIGAAGSRVPQRDRTVKQDASSRMVQRSLDALSKARVRCWFHDANRAVETKTLPRGIAAWSPERYCCTEQIVI